MSRVSQSSVPFKMTVAITFIYWAYRLIGATKQRAWDQARITLGEATLDKVIEQVGLADPRHRDKPGIQVHFEKGPLDGKTQFVEECNKIFTPQQNGKDNSRQHFYIRTERAFGQQTIFTYVGLV